MAKRLYNQYGKGVPTPASSSLTAAECPTIQFDSDTIVWEVESDPTEEGLSFTRRLSPPLPPPPPLLLPVPLWMPVATLDCHLCFWQTSYRSKVQWGHTPLGVSLFAGVALRIQRTFHLLDMEEIHRVRCGEMSWIFHARSRSATLPNNYVYTNAKALQILSFLFFFFNFNGGCITMHKRDWLNLISSPSPFLKVS